MADWTKPALGSTYTNFVTEVKDRDVDNAVWFEGSSSTGIPTNSKRLNASTGRFEKWNGTSWVDAVSTFTFPALSVAGALTVSGNAALATITASGAVTLNGGTANGVPYLNASKVLTTGSALTFDGTTQALAAATGYGAFRVSGASGGYFDTYNSTGTKIGSFGSENGGDMYLGTRVNNPIIFIQNGSEGMRLTSTGLGIGTSSPGAKLHTVASGTVAAFDRTDGNAALIEMRTSGSVRGYLGAAASVPFAVYSAAAAELMRLDASGNLGLGVTPSAWDVFKGLQVNQGALASSGNTPNNTFIGSNAYYNAGFKYIAASATATMYQQSAGAHSWHTTGTTTGTVGSAISFTQAMTLNASGQLLVGATTDLGTIGAMAVLSNASAGYALSLAPTTVSDRTGIYMRSTTESRIAWDNSGYLTFFSGTERARIDSSGQMSTTNAAGVVAKAYDARAWVNFNGQGTVAIRSSGNVSSITDNGVGDYTVNFTTAMSSANYSVAATAVNSASGNSNVISCGLYAPSTGGTGYASAVGTASVRVSTRTSSGNQIDTDCVNVAVFL